MKLKSLLLHSTSALLLSMTGLSAYAESASPVQNNEPQSKFHVSLSAGFSMLPGSPAGYWDTGNKESGVDWEVNVGWVSTKKIGAGLCYSGFDTSGTVKINAIKMNTGYMINYVAPQFIYQPNLGNSGWHFNASAGCGVAILTERGSYSQSGIDISARESKAGFGLNAHAGFGYSFNSHLSVIASVGYTHALIKTEESFYYGSFRSDCLSRINFDLGLKYTF